MTEQDKAYLAGLIDGEGTVSLMKTRAANMFRYPCIYIASTSLELLQWIPFGGISTKKTYKAHHKKSYHWYVNGVNAINTLIDILPYMRESKKKARAQKLVVEYPGLTNRNGRYTEEEIAAKLKFEEEFFQL